MFNIDPITKEQYRKILDELREKLRSAEASSQSYSKLFAIHLEKYYDVKEKYDELNVKYEQLLKENIRLKKLIK